MIAGISAAVPSKIETIRDIHPDPERFSAATGVYQRHVSTGQTTVDLCTAAARQIMDALNWTDVHLLVTVTHTPDYYVPSPGHEIKRRLGLSNECIVLDLNAGCAGWVYGMYVMQNLNRGRGLLLVGDTMTRICDKNDISTYPLFGDAGTATAVEGCRPMLFHLGSYGSDAIRVQKGLKEPEGSPYFHMNGPHVFNFAVKAVTECLNNLPTSNHYYLHQSNMMIIQHIEKRTGIKTTNSILEYGNTSAASIPLTMNLYPPTGVSFACGYGSGLSWGAVRMNEYFMTPKIQVI